MKRFDENEKVLLGKHIRSLRNMKGWTQQELGSRADVNYKFVGEIERGQQNPTFNVLTKLALALGVDLLEIFRFGHEIADRKEVETRIKRVLKSVPDEELSRILMVLSVLYPVR